VTDLYQQPLKGAALYNPHLHGKQELISLFAIRKDLLDLLLEDLRLSSGRAPQHHLIIGQRGMGKTMLLRRIAYAIEDDPTLKDIWLPLSFPEEQYNIARLSDFWLNCTDALSDILDTRGEHGLAEDLDERAESLRSVKEEKRAREALALLVGGANRLGRRLVLLVDNVDLVFERIKDQEWLLREILSSEPTLLLIGASSNAVESTFTYNQAFYDFFRVHELEGLSLDETKNLLIHYAEIWQQPEVKRLANQEPARIKVLNNLTGGNPRTIALLFNVLAAGADGDVRTDLEKLLDQCTPLYKARFEALPPQAQQVVHAMAVHWDPISAGELSGLLVMEVNAVSSQLTRLVKQGVVEKVAYEPENKTGFQVSERFFNIWYLMRASRRVRRRLLWLVEFLKIFYSQDQLRDKALSHIELGLSLKSDDRLRYAEYSFALAEAINDRIWRTSLEVSGLYALLKDSALRGELVELIDFERGGAKLREMAGLQKRLEQAKSSVLSSKLDLPDWSGEEFWSKLEGSLLFPLDFKVIAAESVLSQDPGAIKRLKSVLDSESEFLESLYACPNTINNLAKAVHAGLMSGPTDIDGAIHAEAVLGASGLKAVALANLLYDKFDIALMKDLEAELLNTTSPRPGLTWLAHSVHLNPQPSSARISKVVRRVSALAGGAEAIVEEIVMALRRSGRFKQAEDVLKKHLAINDGNARFWVELGFVLLETGEKKRTEEAFRKAVEVSSKNPDVLNWAGLGYCRLRMYGEAEELFERAIEVDSKNSAFWHNLGLTLCALGRLEKAELAYRESIRLNPDECLAWVGLGIILDDLGQKRDAEEAYLRALKGDSVLPLVRTRLAWLYLWRGDYISAKRVAAEDLHTQYDADGVLAALLTEEGNWSAAIEHARNFIVAIMGDDLNGNWGSTLTLFREAVRAGKAREAAALLDELGASERWRPLREALEAIARGSDSYLRRVAPEVRQPAREILKLLREEPSGETSPPKAP
jgi:Flp pilus assembly protein TadD